MKTVLAIIEVDENDNYVPESPIEILEYNTREEILGKLNGLINGYPVRDAAYNALLKVRFLTEKLYRDTANPNAPEKGYGNVVAFLLLANYDKMMGQLKSSIKQRHERRLNDAKGAMEKMTVMTQNVKENTGIGLVTTALDFVVEYIRGQVSKEFSEAEFNRVLSTLQNNKLLYTGELKEVTSGLQAVFTNPDAGFLDVSRVNEVFEKAHEGLSLLENADFKQA